MFFSWRWLLLAFAFTLSGGPLFAASARENRDYAAAVAAFQDGMYDRAEAALAQFIKKYPDSARTAEAVLLQSQAEIKQGKFADAIARLTSPDNQAKAGPLADEYFYWTGEGQFQGKIYRNAAQTWIALAQKFPESRRRLEAVVDAAAAFTELAEWRQTVVLLEEDNGVFQRVAQMDPAGEPVVRGKLLLAQAKFELRDFDGASAILEPLPDLPLLSPELRWQSGRLRYQALLAAGNTDGALAVTTNLLQTAQLETNSGWMAESVAMQADALEKLNRMTEAMSAYQENLTSNAPPERQREAVLKIAGLAVTQNQFSSATNALGKFLAQFTNSPAADIASLALGELDLKNCVTPAVATNQLPEVQGRFDGFIGTFTNSPLLGQAYLDRGWCEWFANDLTNSLDDFKTAAQKIAAQQLPPSEDLLVAWFKMGDAQFALGDFTDALENYRAVLDSLNLFPEASATLGDLALYQSLRASLELKDMAGATNALSEIFKKHPAGELAQSSSLLYGESVAGPDDARALFEQVARQAAGSALAPQIGLAIARTYERDRDWGNAITNYENWLAEFPTNDLRPRAGYSLAWSDYQAGNVTNAFSEFTNFVARFPLDGLAPQAQLWVADYFYNAGDYVNAEKNYKYIFQNTNWLASSLVNRTNLFYPAQLMAGRAAAARLGYPDAIRDYFSKLEADTNCPIDLRVQATFEHGRALMLSDSADTNNPLANFAVATNEFYQIVQLYPAGETNAQAWFYIGECNVQLGNYDAATNAYAQVFDSPSANISARSQAQTGFGIALEKKAALASGGEQAALLNLALDNYLKVINENEYNLKHGQPADSFWLKKAYLQAAPLAGMFYDPKVQEKFYKGLEQALPQLTDLVEQKISTLPPGKN